MGRSDILFANYYLQTLTNLCNSNKTNLSQRARVSPSRSSFATEPVLDSEEYSLSALKIGLKGAIASLF